MKKYFKFYAIAWAILFAVFNIIVFVTPNEAAGMNKFGGAFWVGYIFITLAFIGQLVCSWFALKVDSVKNLFLKLPLITISYTALILTLIAGVLCMVIPNVPIWVGIIVCFVILAFSAISLINAKAAAEIVTNVEDEVAGKTFFIKSLIFEGESLMARTKSEAVKAEVKKVYEAVRYSDPVSNDVLSGIDSQITIRFDALSDAVNADDTDTVRILSEELRVLISDRNKKCKMWK